MKQKFIEWFTKGNNGCAPSINADGSFEQEKTQHMFEAYQAGMAESDRKVEQLAAELSAVDAIHNDAVFITDDHYEQCPPEVQKIIRSLAVLQIPAYQQFLAEVRASGVDALVERRLTAARLAKEAGHEITARDLEGEAIRARVFAMELRKGVQS